MGLNCIINNDEYHYLWLFTYKLDADHDVNHDADHDANHGAESCKTL